MNVSFTSQFVWGNSLQAGFLFKQIQEANWMRRFNPKNQHNFCLNACGRGLWSLFYSVAVLFAVCFMLAIMGFGGFSMFLMLWIGPWLIRTAFVLLSITVLGAIWEAI